MRIGKRRVGKERVNCLALPENGAGKWETDGSRVRWKSEPAGKVWEIRIPDR